MSDADFETLAKARYVSFVTFRKSGVAVKTPVWIAPAGEALYVFSESKAGKVKRLRTSARAQLAPCDARGGLPDTVNWIDARAEIIANPQDEQTALTALRAKYGWQMRLADIGAKLTGRFEQRAYLRILLNA